MHSYQLSGERAQVLQLVHKLVRCWASFGLEVFAQLSAQLFLYFEMASEFNEGPLRV